MDKTAQKDSETCKFSVRGFAKRWLPPCNARGGTLLHMARVVVPDSSFVPENAIAPRCLPLFNDLAGQPNVSVKQLWNRLRSTLAATCTGSYWFIGLTGHIT